MAGMRSSNASDPHKTPQPWGGQRLITGSVTLQTLLVIPIGAVPS